jgi:hypothetical protein
MPEVGEPNRRRTGNIVGTCVTELVEGGANSGLREVRQQGVDRG